MRLGTDLTCRCPGPQGPRSLNIHLVFMAGLRAWCWCFAASEGGDILQRATQVGFTTLFGLSVLRPEKLLLAVSLSNPQRQDTRFKSFFWQGVSFLVKRAAVFAANKCPSVLRVPQRSSSISPSWLPRFVADCCAAFLGQAS